MNDHSLPITDGPHEQPPVYDCRAIVTPPNGDESQYRAFVGNLPNLEASGPTERECLRQLVDRFKAKLIEYRENEESIPWIDPPRTPVEGQQQRWIPVHL